MPSFSLADLIQIPMVVLFVWFVLKNNQQWREFLKERDSKMEGSLERVALSLENVAKQGRKHSKLLVAHDISMRKSCGEKGVNHDMILDILKEDQ